MRVFPQKVENQVLIYTVRPKTSSIHSVKILILSLVLRICDVLSRIPDPNISIIRIFPFPDPGFRVKKISDPRSGSHQRI
jgi:hypothetical protein